jgi:predicted N-acetyltransferase YhbS
MRITTATAADVDAVLRVEREAFGQDDEARIKGENKGRE